MRLKSDIAVKAIKFALIILPVAFLGGIFTGLYIFDYYNEAVRSEILSEFGSKTVFIFAAALQSTVYGVFASFFGYMISSHLSLMHRLEWNRDLFLKVFLCSAVLGVIFFFDKYTFGALIPEVKADYENGITPAYFIASMLYGGVIEEIMMRLFLLSLIILILKTLFARNAESTPKWILIIANVAAAILFAAGHLPSTISDFGHLSPIIVFRCFLLNGGFALFFGYFYEKYGIEYAMLSHAVIHLVSKLLIILI